jgi:wobble nucleotide-excising tRNase
MIHKIAVLKSIGKFKDYQAIGNVAFNKLTLIYGDNGSGKTTLTNIFRSATSGKIHFVETRKTTNSIIPQTAQIIERNATGDIYHTYRTTGWLNTFPNIEIFDIHFIHQNIFSGCDFTDGHKKELYEFVIGAHGVSVQRQIEQNKKDKTDSRQIQEGIEQQIIQEVGNGLIKEMLTPFLAISALPADIDQQIQSAENDLASANSNSLIQTLSNLAVLPSLTISSNFSVIIADIEMTVNTIQDKVLQELFERHCQELKSKSVVNPETWLKTGFLYFESKSGESSFEQEIKIKCPFCKQDVDSLEILKAYALRFNDEFNDFVHRLQTHIDGVNKFNYHALAQKINDIIFANRAAVTSWSTYLPNIASPTIDLVSEEAAIHVVVEKVSALLQEKAANPSKAIDAAYVLEFQETLKKVNEKISLYNEATNAYITGVASFKERILSPLQAQNALNHLKRIKTF